MNITKFKNNLSVIILCGGKGLRLRPLTSNLPKPLIKINEKSILENNLFGVDLNDESVEIAKLSLWLRTAQPNRKLNDLNNNIKCGNSLIDDPEIAGDKAFNWQQEFPQIFAKGGFDVVIGNPPYVRAENIVKEHRQYFISNKSNANILILELFSNTTCDQPPGDEPNSKILLEDLINLYFSSISFNLKADLDM